MKNALTKAAAILATLAVGCASISPADRAAEGLNTAIQKKRWWDAFYQYSLIAHSGSKADWDAAIQKVKSNPEIIQAGLAEFSLSSLKDHVQSTKQVDTDMWRRSDALCVVTEPADCEAIRRNLATAETWIKPGAIVLSSAFDKLTTKEQEQLSERYDLAFYRADDIGLVTERQVEDMSRAGSTTGSEVGSSLASAVYINNAISSGTYNMWADLAVGILGGVAGSAGNRAPIRQ